jgi:hypothetical protein
LYPMNASFATQILVERFLFIIRRLTFPTEG